MKKWIVTALCVGLLAVPVFGFSDIADNTTAQNAAVLETMGVMVGDGNGNFLPDQQLTRSQFCKMTIVALQSQDQEPLYRNRTVFPDVLASHWARGYINLAVSTKIGEEVPLIRGLSNGTFAPDRAITYGEAVTILMRVLGYSDLDAGMLWPQGYLDLAGEVGLTQGLNLGAYDTVTRGQAASLFCNLLSTYQKSGGLYYTTLGTALDDVVVLQGDTTMDNGSQGVLTSQDKYRAKTPMSPSLVGKRGTLILDDSQSVLAFLPQGEQKTITSKTVQAGWILDTTGKKYTVDKNAVTYQITGQGTYATDWVDIAGGTSLNLFYGESGKVEGLYLGGTNQESVMVATQDGAAGFAPILKGVTGYTIYRDGNLATADQISTYDVGYYDPATQVLTVSSSKLSGYYTDVTPNRESPQTVTVFGAELEVLPVAVEQMASFKLGEYVTLLLTTDGNVAGAVSSSKARGDNIGIVKSDSTVELFNGVTVEGPCENPKAVGQLVRVYNQKNGGMTMSTVSGKSTSATLNLEKNTLGDMELSAGCQFFEQVADSGIHAISRDQIAISTIPGNSISFISSQNNLVTLVVLQDVTGDAYTYGMLVKGESVPGGVPGMEISNNSLFVKNSENPEGTNPLICNWAIAPQEMGGIIANGAGDKVAKKVSLTAVKSVKRSDFYTVDEKTYVTVNGYSVLVSDQVQCYNKATGKWFDTLAQARAFSDNLTIYYDRTPERGAKIRVVVAN